MAEAQAAPRVSIVIEGYNESRDQGIADDTIAALAAQDYALDRVEIVLVGSADQARSWAARFADPAPFAAVTAVAAEANNYYALKNRGAAVAGGDVIVFTDSDVRQAPTWLGAIMDSMAQGADVSVGISLFKDADGWSARSLWRWIAVSITFGYILGPIRPARARGMPWPDVTVRGFMDHNVAIRAAWFRSDPYQTAHGRVIASPLLFRSLADAGARIVLNPQQRIVHYFNWPYWLHKLHFRYGYEVYRLRRLDPRYPAAWMARTGPLEPFVTLGWHVLLDGPRWLRLSRLMGMPAPGRWAALPAALAFSVVARSAEALGMIATMAAPERMRRWAESV
jgi:glycosyltransferase involved in cell wall biosynthesis